MYEVNRRAVVLPEFRDMEPIEEFISEDVNWDIGRGKFHGEKDNYGLVYEGYIYLEYDGDWTFGTRSSDGSMLFIDREMVVDNDGKHTSVEMTGKTWFSAGYHELRAEYWERRGDAEFQIYAGHEQFDYQVVPAEMYGHGDC